MDEEVVVTRQVELPGGVQGDWELLAEIERLTYAITRRLWGVSRFEVTITDAGGSARGANTERLREALTHPEDVRTVEAWMESPSMNEQVILRLDHTGGYASMSGQDTLAIDGFLAALSRAAEKRAPTPSAQGHVAAVTSEEMLRDPLYQPELTAWSSHKQPKASLWSNSWVQGILITLLVAALVAVVAYYS